jgi:hypothetical protein
MSESNLPPGEVILNEVVPPGRPWAHMSVRATSCGW